MNTNNDLEEAVYNAIERREKEICTEIIATGCVAAVSCLLFGTEVTFFLFMGITVGLIALEVVLAVINKVRKFKATRAAERGTTS